MGGKLQKALRVLVVDDHEVVRRTICELLTTHGFKVIGEAANGLDSIPYAEEFQPDVVVLDVTMPTLGGIEAAPRIHEVAPNSGIVFLSQHDSNTLAKQALATGAQGYVLKSDASTDLIPAIRAALVGETFLSKLGR
ncbi:MAG: response regulator transcription factor [Candidatus Sulfotelmatobacter sp.]